jgi:omega-6 fatty acid desaturase (delta-12 desaturase)
MEPLYTEEDIQLLTIHTKKYHATSFIEPNLHLTTTAISIWTTLYGIHKYEEYSFILIFLLCGLLMRTFMIFHDLNHNSFYPKNKYNLNNNVAKIIETFALYPASRWKRIHSIHHHVHGNLSLKDDTRTVFSVAEYNKLTSNQQMMYDIGRNPFVFFSILPMFVFWINKFIEREYFFIFKYLSFLMILGMIGSTKLVFSFLLAHYIGGVLGTMMFHLQHQVNVGYWKPFDNSNKLIKNNADIIGSSVITIPRLLEYFTIGIEYHNIHHFDILVPGYNIQQCYEDGHKQLILKDIKVGYIQMFKSLFHVLYNEDTGRYESSPFFRKIGLQW